MDAPTTDMAEELDSSKLGTKEFWDSTYERELEHFKESGDTGEIWFGEESVERVVDWIEECVDIPMDARILDLGCGNGAMLVELFRRGYPDLTGVDYSNAAVELAVSIAQEKEMEIQYEVADILESCDSCASMNNTYDVCIDKGTYDAVSLSPEDPKQKRMLYKQNLQRILADGGLFVITSCNWTEEELQEHFKDQFFQVDKIATPTFQFGGKTGSRETSLIFRKGEPRPIGLE